LITDAQIGNESAILELLKTAPDLPVHCFGIDVALNDALLLALCRQQGGTFHSLNVTDDVERALTSLGQTLGQPVLLDLRLSNGWELADAALPNLYAGQIHFLSARCPKEMPLAVTAKNARSEQVQIQFDRQPVTVDAPYLHWCRTRIQRLVAEGNETDAVALSVRSNLICPLTAFIAWDESEKVAIATQELVQPSMEVHDVQFGRCAFVGAWDADFAGLVERQAAQSVSRFSLLKKSTSQLSDTGALDELELRRKLSDLCHKSGVVDWQPLVKAIFDWVAEATGHERQERVKAVSQLLDGIKIEAERIEQLQGGNTQQQLDEAREKIQQLLKMFTDGVAVRK
jgi:hypothetical protein